MIKSVSLIIFYRFFSEFDFKGYMPQILNMKKEVMHLLLFA